MARILKIHNHFQPPKINTKKVWIGAAVIIVVILLLLNSSLFSLKYIEVEGNERVS